MFTPLEVQLAAALRGTDRWPDIGPCWCVLQRKAAALNGTKLHTLACQRAQAALACVPADAKPISASEGADGMVEVRRLPFPHLFHLLDQLAVQAGEGDHECYALNAKWAPWLNAWDLMLKDGGGVTPGLIAACCDIGGAFSNRTTYAFILAGADPLDRAAFFTMVYADFCAGDMG